jgi:hypothetical protein
MALDFQESKHNSKLSIKISKNVNILPMIKSNFKKLQKHLNLQMCVKSSNLSNSTSKNPNKPPIVKLSFQKSK